MTVVDSEHYRQEIKSILYAVQDIKQDEKDTIHSMMSDLTIENAALMLKKIVLEARERRNFLQSQTSDF